MKQLRSGFARRGFKTHGREIYTQLQLDQLYLKTDNGKLVFPKGVRRNLYIYGSTNSSLRTWGFPGSLLGQGRVRHLSPPTWDVFPYSDIKDRGKTENTGLLRTIDKTTGATTTETRREAVLRSTVAQSLFLIRDKGKLKKFSFPKTIIDDFTWLMPSKYVRSEGYMKIDPGTAVFTGENSRRKWTLIVDGHSTYTSLSDMADRSMLSKHWKSNGNVAKFHLMQQARARAIQKVRRNDIELCTVLAESRKTISHLASTAMDVIKLYRAVKRGEFKTVWSIIGLKHRKQDYASAKKLFYATRKPAQRWLELQYAWYPLIGDINGAIKTLMKESRQQMTFRVTGNSKEDINYNVMHAPLDPSRTELHVAAGQTSAKCILHYAVTDPALVLASEWGMNPLSAIWEIVPWSFVVDWFTNIGTFLETIDVGIGKEFISGTETYFTILNRESRLPIQKISFPVSPLEPQGGSSFVTSHFMAMERNILEKFPTVGAYIKNPLSTTHVLNAIALARTIKK